MEGGYSSGKFPPCQRDVHKAALVLRNLLEAHVRARARHRCPPSPLPATAAASAMASHARCSGQRILAPHGASPTPCGRALASGAGQVLVYAALKAMPGGTDAQVGIVKDVFQVGSSGACHPRSLWQSMCSPA